VKSCKYLSEKGGELMSQKKKGSMSEETFDEFLASQDMLEACEDHAIKEMIVERTFHNGPRR
jgi:hypothetical protein